MRRRLYQDIGSYTVKDVKVDESGNTATVTFNSKKLHSKGLASSTREVLTTLIGGVDNLGKYIKLVQTLTSSVTKHWFLTGFLSIYLRKISQPMGIFRWNG